MAKPEMPRARRSWLTVLLVFVLALVVRRAVSEHQPLDYRHDPDGYLRIADNLTESGVYALNGYPTPIPTAFRPPLYPLLISVCNPIGRGALALLAAAHVLLGAATVVLTLLVAERWGLSRRGALLAAALVAIDPILLNQSVQPMTETLAAFLAALALWVLPTTGTRPSLAVTIGSAAVLALAVLCRPTFLVWLALIGSALVALAPGWWRRLATACTFAAAALAVLAPWAVRNYAVFGTPIVTTTHGGFTLHLANNSEFYRHLRGPGRFAPWHGFELAPAIAWDEPAQELSQDRDEYRAASEAMRAEPGMFLFSAVYRVSRLWGIYPLATEAPEPPRTRALRCAVALFYGLEFALAAWGAWLLGRKWLKTPWLWALLLALSFTTVHSVYWTDMRMRAPLVCAIALAAGIGVSRPASGMAVQRVMQ